MLPFEPHPKKTQWSARELYQALHLNWLETYSYQSPQLEEEIDEASKLAPKVYESYERAKWYGAYYRREILKPKTDQFYIQWSGTQLGFGLYAKQTIKKGSAIGPYLGLVRARSYFRSGDVNAYCFSFPLQPSLWKQWFYGAWTIDALKYGNHTRFINHSDQPNCEAVGALVQSKMFICIFAKEEIQEGSQLFYNYGEGYWQSRKDQIDPHSVQT